MPDSAWVSAGNQAAGRYEDNWEQGRPPEDGFRRESEEQGTQNLPNGVRRETTTVTFSNVTATPDAVPVYEMCDKCGEHVHRVETASGPYDLPADLRQHVKPGHFGDHAGTYYPNCRYRGIEIRRERTVTFINGRRLAPQEQWTTRNVDHTRDGLEWFGSISSFECLGSRETVAMVSSERVCTAIMEAVDRAGLWMAIPDVQIRFDTLAPLLRQAMRTDRASIEVESGKERAALVLFAGEARRRVGSIDITYERGAVRGSRWKSAK
jgi:hypothetical protein